MTKAQVMQDHWVSDPEPIWDVEQLARTIDQTCQIDDCVYTGRKRFIFGDHSIAFLTNNRLIVAAT